MAKKTTTASGAKAADAMEQRLVAFAEQLGRMAGTFQAKADGWMDRETLNRQIASVRDGAADLLEQLAGGAKKAAKKGDEEAGRCGGSRRSQRAERRHGRRARQAASQAGACQSGCECRSEPGGEVAGGQDDDQDAPAPRARLAALHRSRWRARRAPGGCRPAAVELPVLGFGRVGALESHEQPFVRTPSTISLNGSTPDLPTRSS